MDDLQEKIIEALYEAPESLVAESAFGALAHNVAIQRARKRAKAVMGVVELHLAELEAERDLHASTGDVTVHRNGHNPIVETCTSNRKERAL